MIARKAAPATAESRGETAPAKRPFVNRSNQPRLSPEQAARQGRAVTSALRAFPSPGAAMAFLNGDHDGLGRPLDLAVESSSGLAAVEAALALRLSALR